MIIFREGKPGEAMQFHSNVLPLAISQFRRDWPFMASRLDGMRERAASASKRSAAAAAVPGAGNFSTDPDGNHGDNKTSMTGEVVL